MDGAAFERLCGQVLRKMVPELANLISSGINADGSVIKSLSDGFCFINRNHYASVHVTTNASNLKKKWLYNGTAKTTPLGDLIKGIGQAKEMHTNNPDYRFSIYLVSNKRVDEDLHIQVNQINSHDFIIVRIIEQRDLVSFLDYEPEGQYLRKHFLGIDANRISVSLLEDILKINLERYKEEIYLDEAHWVNASFQETVNEQLKSSNTSINLLTGESGFGKSSLCFSMLRNVLQGGDVALRIKPSVIEKAISLEDAIQQQVKSDFPKLFVHPKDIQTLFQSGLIVIDDINKSTNVNALLDKIISWNQIKQADVISVLCPVWPSNLANMDNKVKKTHKFTAISLGRFSFYANSL